MGEHYLASQTQKKTKRSNHRGTYKSLRVSGTLGTDVAREPGNPEVTRLGRENHEREMRAKEDVKRYYRRVLKDRGKKQNRTRAKHNILEGRDLRGHSGGGVHGDDGGGVRWRDHVSGI